MSGIFERSITGALLIGIILLVRLLLAGHLPRRTFTALWTIALLHLLLPRLPYSPLSLYNLGKTVAQPAEMLTVGEVTGKALQVMLRPEMQAATDVGRPSVPLPQLIWIIGAVLCALGFLVVCLHSRRSFRDAVSCRQPQVTAWQQADPRRKHLRILESCSVQTPLSYGLLRPTILLPATLDWTQETALAYVLTHEEIHLRRGHLWFKAAAAAAVCLYWFSPAVWMLWLLSGQDLELSCDEAVLRRFGGQAKAGYAMALITMEEHKRSWVVMSSGFSQNALEARITAIMKAKNYTKTALIAAVVLCLCITAGFAATGEPISDTTQVEVTVTPAKQPAELEDLDIDARLEQVIEPAKTDPECEHEPEPELEPESEKPPYDPEAEPAVEVWYWPVPVSNHLTGRFGARVHPITGEKMVYDHITIAADKDVLAAQSGKVMEVGYDAERGNFVAIDHGNGYATWYAHLAETTVRVGEYIEGGMPIGTAGKTGKVTGNCLSFWVYENGTSVDPMQFYNLAPKFTEGEEVQQKLPELVKK